MTKSRAPGSESDSTRKKKFKPSADDVTGVENMRTEMNGKTKKKRKTEDEVCESVQMMQSTDTTNTEKRKHKNKKRKTEETNTDTIVVNDEITRKKKKKLEIPQDAEQIDTTLTQEEEDHTEKKKKRKKKKHKDCDIILPEADVLKPQEAKHKTQTSDESADKPKKKHREADISGDLEDSSPTQEACEDGSDGEEDLSPEERRVLERKLKKIRKKEEKTKLREEGKSTKTEKIKEHRAEKQALEYLTCWSERRDQWRFQKTRQTWLLQHMYDSVKVPDSYFEMLLSYLKGLRGAARETSLQKAEALVRWEGQGEEEDATDSEKKKQRANLVIQML